MAEPTHRCDPAAQTAPPRLPQRRALLVALLGAIILVATAPTATAQFTPYGVQLAADPATATVAETGQCTSHTVTVTNTGQAIGPPHTIEITASQPTGWTLRPAPPQTISLASGQTGTFNVGLCAGPNVDPETPVTVNIRATVTDNPQITSPQRTATVSVQATLGPQPILGVDIPDTLLFIVLGLMILLVVVVVFTRRKGTQGIALQSPEGTKAVTPGRGTSYPIRLRNEGTERDVVRLQVSSAPPGWETFLPLQDLALDPREEQTVWLSVRSPESAQIGDQANLTITAISSAANGHRATIETVTQIVGGKKPAAPPPNLIEVHEFDDEGNDRSVVDDKPPKAVAVKRRKATD